MKKKLLIVLAIILLVAAGVFIFKVISDNKADKNNENMDATKNTETNLETNPESELKIDIIKEGTGVGAKAGDNITVNYTGTFVDGTQFDSSIGRMPLTFTLGAGRVIKGWDLGLIGMKVGEIRKLTIPYNLAYGEAGYGPIPAKATLIFEVEMLAID